MAQPGGTFDTFSAVGEREDLQDIIYNISPVDTPFMSNAARGKAKAVFHEWQTDSLVAANSNAVAEGNDAAYTTAAPTVRVGNYCQISSKTVLVSGTLDSVDKAGRKSELSYQISKRGKELKRDMEYILTQNQNSSAGSSAIARNLGGLEAWLSTNETKNTSADATATTPGFSSGTVGSPIDGTTQTTITEANLKLAIQKSWTQGGDPRMVMAGPVNKQYISAFTGIATQYRNNPQVGPATIIGSADVYVSDFGTHNIVPNRFTRERTVLVLDMDYLSVAYLRPMQQMKMAKTGDAEKRLMLCEYTLVVKNEAASAKITNTIAS
jgi:hypothetical protein